MKQTSLEQEELSHGQENAEETPKQNSSELLERVEIEGTPLYVTGNDEVGWAITFGKHRLTEMEESRERCMELMLEEHWNITARMMGVIADITWEEKRVEIDAAIKRYLQK